MSLIKYARPNADMYSTRFSDLFDEFFNERVNYKKDSFMPSVDISETEKAFEIEVALPGIKKQDINIDLVKSRLTITGERKLDKEEDGKNYHRVESSFGTFKRSFQLPDSIDEDSINATYTDGILNINIAKSEEKASKQIKIS